MDIPAGRLRACVSGVRADLCNLNNLSSLLSCRHPKVLDYCCSCGSKRATSLECERSSMRCSKHFGSGANSGNVCTRGDSLSLPFRTMIAHDSMGQDRNRVRYSSECGRRMASE